MGRGDSKRGKSTGSGTGKSQNKGETSTLQKALVRGAGYTKDDFPELSEVLYWMKQIIGVVIGLIWGVIPLLGATGIVSFGLVNAGLVFLYVRFYLDADVESYGLWELISEGFFPSFGLFVLSWSITYTGLL